MVAYNDLMSYDDIMERQNDHRQLHRPTGAY